MEEIRNFEEVTEQAMDAVQEANVPRKGIAGIVVAAFVGVVAATAVTLHKTKDAREAKQVERWRKKGYVMYKAEETEAEVDPDVDGDTEEK